MMKGFKRFFIYLTILLIMSISLLILVAGSTRYADTDGVMMNGIVQTVKDNRDNLDALNEKQFDTDILLFDSDNKKIYSTSDKVFETVKVPLDAVREGMITMPVNDGEVFLGTVVVPNPAGTAYKRTIKGIILVTVIISLVLIISYITFLYYINRNVVKPFKRMKEIERKA